MTVGSEGRSLELYFIEGRPDGILTAEVFNWTGHVLMTPRTRIAVALARKEASFTGVYILLGEKDGHAFGYIGEGEDISQRMRSHDAQKEWWTTAVLVTSAANNLHKAHVKYLEARLIEEARSIGRIKLENGVNPARPSLSEAARANMEAFLDYLFIVLPALRIDMFIRNTRPPTVSAPSKPVQARFELAVRKHGLRAAAVLLDGEFIVEPGSGARLNWEGVGNWDSSYAALHQELKATGVLQPNGDQCVFAKGYAFSSPSAAAAVVTGRPASGPAEWKVVGSGLSYRDWEAQQLSASAGDVS